NNQFYTAECHLHIQQHRLTSIIGLHQVDLTARKRCLYCATGEFFAGDNFLSSSKGDVNIQAVIAVGYDVELPVAPTSAWGKCDEQPGNDHNHRPYQARRGGAIDLEPGDHMGAAYEHQYPPGIFPEPVFDTDQQADHQQDERPPGLDI